MIFAPVNNFLNENSLYLALAVVALILITLIVFFVLSRKKKTHADNVAPLISALGGIDNIKSATANGSRLSIELVDMSALDAETLKPLGVSSLIKLSYKATLVIGEQAKSIAAYIEKEKR